MTISSTVRIAGPYTGNGVTTSFTFAFKVFSAADVYVVRLDTSSLVETVLVLNTDYTVSLNANQNSNPGGSVIAVTAPTSTQTLTITSNIANLQPTDLTNQGGFYPTVINDALDRSTIQLQQLSEDTDRALKTPLSATPINTELPYPVAGNLIGWNAANTSITNYSPSDILTVAGSSGFSIQTFSGTGSQTAFVLSAQPGSVSNLEVFISGVRQLPTINYTVTTNTLTFVSAPPAGTDNILTRWGQTLGIGIPSDTSVTTAKIADSNVTTAKINNLAVTTAKINNFAVTQDKITNYAVAPSKLSAAGYELGFRNKITNGKFNVWQRGTSFVALAANSYFADRFRWNASTTAVITASRQTDVPNTEFNYSGRITVTTADTSIGATEYAAVVQRIEGFNIAAFINRTITLSFWVKSSKTGTHFVRLGNAAANYTYLAPYGIFTANTWQFVTLTIPNGLTIAGTWNTTNGMGLEVAWVLAAGSSLQAGAEDTWVFGNYYGYNNEQVNVLDTIGNVFALTGVQIEIGTYVTPFEHVDPTTDETRCHRYFREWSGNATVNAAVGTGIAISTSSFYLLIPLSTPMRDRPTVAQFGGPNCFVGTVNTSATIAAYDDTPSTLYVLFNNTGVAVTSGAAAMVMCVSSTQSVTADAEL